MFPSKRITILGGDKFRDEHSLAFDGTDDCVNCGDSADYHHDNSSASLMSVSVWVKITSSTSDDDTIISKYEYTDNKREWRISLDGSQNIKFVSSQNGTNSYTATTSNALVADRWYHIVLTYDGSEGTATNRPKIYLDGVSQSLTFAGGDQPAQINEDDCSLTIGCMLNSGAASGLPPMNVSEATFYNSKLSASQVQTLYNGREPYNHKEGIATGNLKAWWRMGDGSLDSVRHVDTRISEGGVISDESQSSYLGTDLVDDVMNASNWSVFGSNTVELESGAIKITYDDDASGAYFYLRDSKGLTTDLTIGKAYKVSFQAKVNTGSVTMGLYETGGFAVTGPVITGVSYNHKAIYIICTATQDHYLFPGDMSSGEIVYIKDVKVQEVVGNTGVIVNIDSNQFSGDTP